MKIILTCYLLLAFGFDVTIQQQTRQFIAKKDDQAHFVRVFKGILKPRVVGTATHKQVQNFLIQEIKSFGLTVELDEFKNVTPTHGELKFTNIIGKLNPNADKFVTLACHYDSKWVREHAFVGAIDSAVPCAMILNLVKTMISTLNRIKDNTALSLMLIFFDGEEAFRKWSVTDSLYGSRHLAKKWAGISYKPKHPNLYGARITEIDRIETMILLDLIGSPNPQFHNHFKSTTTQYNDFISIEKAFRSKNLLETDRTIFKRKNNFAADVQDDHIPFLPYGIKVLHLIPTQFPAVWHTENDDEEHLHQPTIQDITRILRVFLIRRFDNCDNVNIECVFKYDSV